MSFVRTAEAVEIARPRAKFKQSKLADAINDGHYPAAPQTVVGAARAWGETDLIGLFVFARLIEMDVLARRAGSIASQLVERLRSEPEQERHAVLIGGNDLVQLASGEAAQASIMGGYAPVVMRLELDVAAVRAIVAQGLAEATAETPQDGHRVAGGGDAA